MTSPWAGDDLTRDAFLGGRVEIVQPKRGYRAGTDPVFLASAVPAVPGQSVLELGTGVGTALLCLSARVPGLSLSGLELQEEYAGLARQNAEAAGETIRIVTGDLRAMPRELTACRFDHVMMNPPYFPAAGRSPASDPGKEAARGEDAPLSEWIAAGLRRLAPKGQLTLIQNARRLPEILSSLNATAGTILVRPLAPRERRSASRVIVEARREGRSFTLAPAKVIHEGAAHERDGESYAPEISAVLRDAAPWPRGED